MLWTDSRTSEKQSHRTADWSNLVVFSICLFFFLSRHNVMLPGRRTSYLQGSRRDSGWGVKGSEPMSLVVDSEI